MFFDSSHFPFTQQLENNWTQILGEFERFQGNLVAWPEKHLYENNRGVQQDEAWKMAPLYAFGKKLEHNCKIFPHTTAVIEQIPGITSATFSAIAGGTHIAAHKGYLGYSEAVMRCHLGLVCPDGCRMRVEQETRSWEAGKAFIFDDMMEHEVWNDSDSQRLVFIVDFVVPEKTKYLNPVFLTSPELASLLSDLREQTKQ